MKAFAINGSPRQGGNTETLLNKVLDQLRLDGWETEYMQIGGKPVRGCLACMKCNEKKNGRCIIEGDFVNTCLQKMYEADAIILGSPTYFGDVSTEMKALIDRAGFVSLANGGKLSGKIGAAVVAVRRGGATHVFNTINNLFFLSSMVIPASLYWNFGVACEKDQVLGDAEGILNMEHLGKAISWLGKAIEPVKDTYPRHEVELK